MDITPQKRVEEELRVREEEYRIAVRQSDKLVLLPYLEQTAYLPPESAELFHESTIYNLPEFLNQNSVISPESVKPAKSCIRG